MRSQYLICMMSYIKVKLVNKCTNVFIMDTLSGQKKKRFIPCYNSINLYREGSEVT